MSKIVVRPLTKAKEDLDLFPKSSRSGANSVLNGKMPTIFVAYREDEGPEQGAVVGFRYRRQSHHCELTYWQGRDEELTKYALYACVLQAILEGRKRIELLVEDNWTDLDEEPEYHYGQERGGQLFCKALENAGFSYEGRQKYFTKYFEHVTLYSWVTLVEGLPEIPEDVEIVLGSNDTTEKYRSKNIELYVKDRDYYSYTSGGESGKTFAEILEEQYQWVLDHPQVEIEENWSAK